MIQFKQILVPTDFSEPSQTATRYALELAKKFGSKVHLLYVIEDPMFSFPAFGGYSPDTSELEAYAKAGLDSWIADEDAAGLQIERRFVHGSAFLSILRDSSQHNIDLIVMGTHGRGFTHHLLMGSVAEKVVRKATCPVLTIRPEGYRFKHFDDKSDAE
ncbi:MAG TPA: universal stress protein [Planctomycetaceae bacterium]|nr:universal stress protein [Planctomycetaceae bacterium]